MNPRVALATSILFNLTSYTLVLRWYVWPRLADRGREDALIPLVSFHWIRTLGLLAVVPGMTSAAVAETRWAHHVFVGDALTVVLAWLAVALLRRRAKAAIPVTWLMNVVGSIDVVNAGCNAVGDRILDAGIGPHALVIAFGVPALIVTHVAMFRLLLWQRKPPATAIAT